MGLELSQEQEAIVRHWDSGMAVLAGAGSGKTTTLVLKCEELLRIKPDARIAAVSFTEKSASDLRVKLSRILELRKHWVSTIHGLCGKMIREFPREAELDGEERVLTELESRTLWERAIRRLWLEELPPDVERMLERLLERESKTSLTELLGRTRDLESFGVSEFLQKSKDQETQALEVVFTYVFSHFERLKEREAGVDFNDLEKRALRVLSDESVRRSYRQRFDLVLVDEFQDTNPVQAKIVRAFADPDKLVVVGDPKQSIYRFRDADVSLFEEFCSGLPAQFALTRNFRSRPEILDFTNQVCEKAFMDSDVEYLSLEAARESVNAESSPPQNVRKVPVESPEKFAAWIHAELARGVLLEDMALLLRKIRGKEKWLRALEESGIPVAIESGGFFWEDPRVRELCALLRWWNNPGNRLSGAVFFRAPWVGISDSVLDEWFQDSEVSLVDRFFSLKCPLANELKKLKKRVIRPGEILMALMEVPEIKSQLGSQILELWHRLEEWSSQGLAFHDVTLEVSKAIQENRREAEVPPPRNKGQLRVLTLHSAKGLEFPHVILLDLMGPVRSSAAPSLFWDRKRGAFLGRRNQEGDRDKEDPGEKEWRKFEFQKNLSESKRLFYVALTRAQESLALVYPEIKKPKKQVENAYLVDDWRGWVDQSEWELFEDDANLLEDVVVQQEAESKSSSVKDQPANRSALPSVSSSASQPISSVAPGVPTSSYNSNPSYRPRHSVTEWNLLEQCPRAYEWKYIRPKLVADSDDRKAASDLGTRVHAALERGGSECWEELQEIEHEYGVSHFNADEVRKWLAESRLMMDDPSEGVEEWKVYKELAFEVPVGKQAIVGAMDRLIYERAGRKVSYHIVDFKISKKRKSEKELLQSYARQLNLYVWALGVLEPQAQNRTLATIVSISPKGAIELTLAAEPFAENQARVETILAQVQAIVSGEAGETRPGSRCQYCEFSSICESVPRDVRSSISIDSRSKTRLAADSEHEQSTS